MFACDHLPTLKDPSLKVADLLKNNGFTPTSPEGKAISHFSGLNCLGVISDKILPKSKFLGALYFQDENFGAHGKNWVFKVESLEHIEPAEKIIGFLLDEFHIPILLSHSKK